MRLVQTCGACPEQYDVFDGEEQVGYLRLRHGYFAAYAGDASGPCVYDGLPDGDGIFTPAERPEFLRSAVLALGGDGTYTVESPVDWWS